MFTGFPLTKPSIDDPTQNMEIQYPASVPIQAGGNAEIQIKLKIPAGNYIFVEHLSDAGMGVLTSFHIDESSGLKITEVKKPAGVKQTNEIIVYDLAVYMLFIKDNKTHAPGSEINAEIEITTQLCSKNDGICFLPHTFRKNVAFTIIDSSWSDKDYENHTYDTFAELPAANKRIDFENIDYPLLYAAIFFETNRQRIRYKRKVFLHSPALEKAAKGHSDDMVKYNFFSHTSPVKGKETMTKRLALAGITSGYRGENIAYSFGIEYKAGKSVYNPDQNNGYFSYSYKGDPILNHTYLGLAKEVLNQWMNSPGHKANILDTKFTYLGTGASHYKNPGFYNMDNFKCTQNFGSTKGPVE